MGCSESRDGKDHDPSECLVKHLINSAGNSTEPIIPHDSDTKLMRNIVFCVTCQKFWQVHFSRMEIKAHYKCTGHRLYVDNSQNALICQECGIEHSLNVLPESIATCLLYTSPSPRD
eukprot:TRINITY_DN14920_c0_g1_i2.p2 TRINITY_DN14920_c0_g1~~TRINITY_DN14920_c0_g1_i2.p2  ORF type:complete len:117 (-),score=9.01 TRINITY_DN14920_c0_g1_i2:56-406(-)